MRKIKKLTVQFEDDEELVLVGRGVFHDVRTVNPGEVSPRDDTPCHYVYVTLSPVEP